MVVQVRQSKLTDMDIDKRCQKAYRSMHPLMEMGAIIRELCTVINDLEGELERSKMPKIETTGYPTTDDGFAWVKLPNGQYAP